MRSRPSDAAKYQRRVGTPANCQVALRATRLQHLFRQDRAAPHENQYLVFCALDAQLEQRHACDSELGKTAQIIVQWADCDLHAAPWLYALRAAPRRGRRHAALDRSPSISPLISAPGQPEPV